MFIEYDEYELLELFENEPVAIFKKEVGHFIYNKKDDRNINLGLTILTYEKECIIDLSLEEQILFEVTLKEVEYLQSDGESLRIHQKDSSQDYLIFFKPSIFIKVDRLSLDEGSVTS